MADLRIVDAPEIPTENITGEEKIPTGGSGNYSITLDSLADYTKTKKDLADNTTVDNKVNDVRQELNTHTQDLSNPHQVTKAQIGLGNVDNTADVDKPVSNATQAVIISAITPKANKTYVDSQLAIKADLVNGVVPSSQLPTYVDDVLEYTTTTLPLVGEIGKIYVTTDTNRTWRWGGSQYIEISNGGVSDSTLKLQTPRNIAGVDFNGTQNINIPHNNLTDRDVEDAHPASAILDTSGLSQQQINDLTVSAKHFGALGDGLGTLATSEFIDYANSFYTTTGNLWLQEPRFKLGFDTTDFVALQLALDMAATKSKDLFIPAGDYVITKCLIVKRGNIRIFGEGMFKTLIRQSASVGFLSESSDDSQILVGGKVYGSYNYGTGKQWSATGVFKADNVTIENIGVVGDMSGFSAGGWYMAGGGANLPTLQSTQIYQSGLQIQGELARFSKNIEVRNCYFKGHAECGIEPSYVDGLVVEKCYATQNGWQFFGTDHSIKNVKIINNVGIEPAVGNSESAFIDLEEGQGASYENILISGNTHIATNSGFLKLHPKNTAAGNATNIKNVQVIGNYSNAFGAPTLGFIGQFWTGAATGEVWGNIENLIVSQNIILNYKGDVFRIGASEAGSGKAINVKINDNIIIPHPTEAVANSVIFSLPKLVEGFTAEGNTIIAKSGKQYLSRIGWASASDDTKIPKNISFKNNSVLINSAGYMIEISQVDGLTINENEIDASITTTAAFGGFLGLGPGGRKHNITVKNNSKIKLGQREFLLAYYQQLKNLVIEDNNIFAETPDTATRTLFNLNQQVIGASIKRNIIKAGVQQILSIGGGVSTASANKCANISFDDNIIEHSCSDIAFEVRQCVNLGFSRNKVESTAGGSGLVVPVYTTSGMFLLEGRTTVKDNELSGLGSGTQRIGIRLSYNVDDSKSFADVSGNTLQAMAGSYMSYPITIEGKPRVVKVNNNILFGVENAANRYGITVTGSTATPKVEAIIANNLTHGGASTLAVSVNANVNATQSANHLSTSY